MEKNILLLIPIYIFYIALLGIFMFRKRVSAIRSKKVSLGHFRSYDSDSPQDLLVLKNHFSSQFEIPILFFITCLSAELLGAESAFIFVLGCVFILSRFMHSYIHLGSNNVKLRALYYFLGVLCVLTMWVGIVLIINRN